MPTIINCTAVTCFWFNYFIPLVNFPHIVLAHKVLKIAYELMLKRSDVNIEKYQLFK